MSLPPPSLLVSLTSSIRARPIPWESYQRAGVINEAELKRIKAVDKVRKEQRASIVEGDSDVYVQLVLGGSSADEKSLLEKGGKRVDVVQYLLVLVGELCEDVPSFTNALLAHPRPFDHLTTLLSHADNPIPILASSILTTLLAASLVQHKIPNSTKESFAPLIKYLSTLASSSESNLQDLAIQSYVVLLRSGYARSKFWEMGDDVMKTLVDIMETAAVGSGNKSEVGYAGSSAASTASPSTLQQGGVGLQLLYHVLLVFWELSYDDTVAEELYSKYDLIPPLVHLLRSAIKEKILRLTLAIITNLINKAPSTNLPALLLAKLLPTLSTLKTRKFNDPDLESDLDACLSNLESFQLTQTTFDEYATEIRSGHLAWTPPHRSDDFWKKNARKIMEENGGELPKCLARVLKESQEKNVLAIAAHDVGLLVKEVPEKRRVWDGLLVKARIMELMGDSDAEVRYESLKTVQEFLKYAFGG